MKRLNLYAIAMFFAAVPFVICNGQGKQPDVYVAGTRESVKVGGNSNSIAVLWKNGIEQKLSDTSENAEANSVFVSGNDVYIAGYTSYPKSPKGSVLRYVATLWKNGVAQNLSDGSVDAMAYSVFVSGNDVYVVGEEGNNPDSTVAKLWKNGVEQNIADSVGVANSVFVFNNDVYIVGSKTWENGNVLYNNGGFSIYASGKNVYVAGGKASPQSFPVAQLWKNGVAQNLTDTNIYSMGNAVFVSDSNVYVAGKTFDPQNPKNQGFFMGVATLWKNGEMQYLTDGSTDASAESVYVLGNDVYVAGSEFDLAQGYIAKLWKNGVAQNLTDGHPRAWAHSIFVK